MLYNLIFNVSKDTAAPSGDERSPLRAGVYGDKGQATVTFNLSEDVPFGDDYYYRVEIVDGAGGYDVTGPMAAENGTVVVDIPTAWTTPGVAALRLVAVETDAEGNENARFHSLPMYIYFDDRNDGSAIRVQAEAAWQEFLAKAAVDIDNASRSAERSAADAKSAQEAADAAEKAAKSAATDAAQGASEHVEEAKQIKAECEDILEQVETLTDITSSMKRVVGV